jgi:hypothetical protein
MRTNLVRALLAAGTIGAAALATCTGDTGPAGPAGATGPAGDPGIENFTAALSEADAGSGSTATGTASFSVVGQTLLYNIDVTGLTDVTRAHIHGPAGLRSNAGVVQSLCVDDDAPLCKTGTVTGVLVAGAAARSRVAFDSVVVSMRSGNAYVNVHTAAFPVGEIRGQIVEQ